MLREFTFSEDSRILVGMGGNEDAVIVRFPENKALVQTVDFLTPIVNNPYWFGQIAAANSLSDIYAMGGEPYTAMNIVCFPADKMDLAVMKEILRGGFEKVREAGAVLAGGHSVKDDEIKYGLSVSGTVDPDCFATNAGLQAGDQLLLTKPIGTGVLATALKADFDTDGEVEKTLYQWCSRLNKHPAEVTRQLKIRAATDITGFGLGGHLMEMARASKKKIRLWSDKIPYFEKAVELASMGMLPGGSFQNRQFCAKYVRADSGIDPVKLDLIFDAQTSGGILMGVPEHLLYRAMDMLREQGEMACHIGEVVVSGNGRDRSAQDEPFLEILPG